MAFGMRPHVRLINLQQSRKGHIYYNRIEFFRNKVYKTIDMLISVLPIFGKCVTKLLLIIKRINE